MDGVSHSWPKAEYPPSWIDRMIRWVEGKPLPIIAGYALTASALVGLFLAIQYWGGAYRQGVYGWHIFIALQPLIPIAAIHYLDRVAQAALEQFRPSLVDDESAYSNALYRLTTMPARASAVAGVVGVGFSIILFTFLQDLTTSFTLAKLASSTLSRATFLGYILIAWFGFGIWVFHTIHQLKVIQGLYTNQAEVDAYNPEALYALSSITSRTALIILANTYGWFAVNTKSGMANPNEIYSLFITNIFFIGLGLLIFIWPLWGAHRLLDQVKSAALTENSKHLNLAVGELHQRVSEKDVTDIDGWEKALSALQIERVQLEKMPTWPWSPGTLRNFLLALVVPVLVWALQLGLQRMLE